MDKIVMRGKEYKITSNENQYDLEVNGNTLLLKRGEQAYITLDLDKVCLGTKLEILKNVGILLERTTGEQADIFEMWTEINPGKTFDEFAADAKKILCKYSKNQEIQMVGIQEGLPVYGFVIEGMVIGTFVAEKRADVCYENITADLKPLRVTSGTPKEIVEKENTTIEKNSQRKHELYKILSEEINDEFRNELRKDILELMYTEFNRKIKNFETNSDNLDKNVYEIQNLQGKIKSIQEGEIVEIKQLIRIYNKTKLSLGI